MSCMLVTHAAAEVHEPGQTDMCALPEHGPWHFHHSHTYYWLLAQTMLCICPVACATVGSQLFFIFYTRLEIRHTPKGRSPLWWLCMMLCNCAVACATAGSRVATHLKGGPPCGGCV